MVKSWLYVGVSQVLTRQITEMKLFVLLLIFTCVAWQQSDAYIWEPRPGPIGMPRRFGRLWRVISKRAERDLGTELDTDEDGYLDETELENHLSERDILDFIEALDANGDEVLSVDEFNNKQ